jgi:hypothetical protein
MDLIWAARSCEANTACPRRSVCYNGPKCLERAWAGTAALSPPRVIALVEGQHLMVLRSQGTVNETRVDS